MGREVLGEYRVVEQRYDAVIEVLRDGQTVTEVAERWGVSRQSLHAWINRYAAGGLEALADRSHRPRHCPHQTTARTEARICELRRRHPDWGPRRLHHELGRDGLDPVPSRSAIYRTLVRYRLIEPVARRRRRADYRRWERDRPMELWQLDVMGGIWLQDGHELKAVTGIDDHSRFCVAAGLVQRANARSVCGVFQAALDRYGVPDEVLTDNGKVFTGRLGPHPAEVLFDRICRQHGITHLCTGVRCPTTTGKIERFHKTLRSELFTGRSALCRSGRGAAGPGRLGGRLQQHPAASSAGHALASPAVLPPRRHTAGHGAAADPASPSAAVVDRSGRGHPDCGQ